MCCRESRNPASTSAWTQPCCEEQIPFQAGLHKNKAKILKCSIFNLPPHVVSLCLGSWKNLHFQSCWIGILVWNSFPHPPVYKVSTGTIGMMQTAGNSPCCLSSHNSTSSKSCVGNRSLGTQSQPFPACFSHLFLTACSCHLDLSGLDLVIPDVVWHFQFIRNAFVYFLGGFFFFISFFHSFSFSLGCVEAFCLGCQCKRPLPCREVPPTPVLSEIRTVISPVSSTLSGLGAVIKQKGRLIMFLYFSVLFCHFIVKSQVLEHWSKWGFKIRSLFLNLRPPRGASGLEFACWWHFQFTQPVFAFLSRLSLLPVACKCEFASKLKMAQPAFKLLHLSILH